MKNNELAKLINHWFNKTAAQQNKWNNNAVGKIIKKHLISLGNWKNAPRGNPRRGREIMMENKAKKEGYEENNESDLD